MAMGECHSWATGWRDLGRLEFEARAAGNDPLRITQQQRNSMNRRWNEAISLAML